MSYTPEEEVVFGLLPMMHNKNLLPTYDLAKLKKCKTVLAQSPTVVRMAQQGFRTLVQRALDIFAETVPLSLSQQLGVQYAVSVLLLCGKRFYEMYLKQPETLMALLHINKCTLQNLRTTAMWAEDIGFWTFQQGKTVVMPPVSKVLAETSSNTSETPRVLPETSSNIYETPKVLPETSSSTSETPKVLPETSSNTSETPKVLLPTRSTDTFETPRIPLPTRSTDTSETPRILAEISSARVLPEISEKPKVLPEECMCLKHTVCPWYCETKKPKPVAK